MNTQAQIFLTILAGWMNRKQSRLCARAGGWFVTTYWALVVMSSLRSSVFAMDLAKRTVMIAHIGCQVDGQVMAQVARNLTDYEDGFLRGKRFFICDNDPLYTQQFETILNSAGIEIIRTLPNVPEQNGYAERFVRSIKKECLDHFIFLGEKSLRKAVHEYVEHYHHERNHQGLDNLIPMPYISQNNGPIAKSERLGGLLNYTYRESETRNGKEEARAA